MLRKRLSLCKIPIDALTFSEVLEKIKLYLTAPRSFVHIVSVNPENVVIAHQNPSFMKIYQNADLALTDGIGIILGAKLLGMQISERVSGSVLLPRLLDLAGAMSLTVALIGSQADLALRLAQCYSRSYPEATFIGSNGYANWEKPTPEEERAIEAIVRSRRPHFVFVAFGSPAQELWIDSHRTLLEGSICMGVGGAFNYLAGASQTPPPFVRALGLEWAYRLITEPWRLKRQLTRLPIFIGLIISEWFRGIIPLTHEKTPR